MVSESDDLSSVLLRWGAVEETPVDLYTDVFRLGEGMIQREGEPPGEFKANPVILGGDGDRVHRKILFEDTFEEVLAEFQDMDWAFVSGCTYFGRVNSSDRASKMFAMIFDIDGVTPSTLNNFLSGAIAVDAYPVPQHVVLSGHGVHLYYVLDDPVSLYPNVKTQLKDLKYALTDKLWNGYTSIDEHIQHQGINQGFRVPGGMTKVPGVRARAFRLNTHPTDISELNSFVPKEHRADVGCLWREARWTLSEAREKFPEWYERVVVGGADPGQWVVKEDLYRWWIRRIEEGASYGHRYFCIMVLAIIAAKCGIYDHDRVKADAMALVPFLDGIKPDEPFTEADVDSALECLDSRYVKFPRDDCSRLSGIDIKPNKRNGRKQKQHMAVMRAIQGVTDPDGEWRNKNGAPTKCDMIRAYAADHPEANQSEISRALGVSRPTVAKWLKPGWRKEFAVTSGIAEIDAKLAERDAEGLPWGCFRGDDDSIHAYTIQPILDALDAADPDAARRVVPDKMPDRSHTHGKG